MKVGIYINKIIEELKIKYYFAIPGDYNLIFLDQLLENTNINPIYCTNELNMAYAADGYARINGISICISTFSVGGLSAINGIAGAYAEDSPVLHISCGPHMDEKVEFHTVHHSIGEVNTEYVTNIYKNVTIYSKRIDNISNVINTFEEAIKYMKRYNKPAYIELPMNLVNENLTINMNKNKLINYNNCFNIKNKELLNNIINDINNSNNPIVIIGTKIRNQDYKKYTLNFINKLNTTYCCLPNAKGILSEENRNYIGIYWQEISDINVEKIINKADYYIYIGCLLNDYNTSGFKHKCGKNNSVFINLDNIFYKNVKYNINNFNKTLNYITKNIIENSTLLNFYIKNKKIEKIFLISPNKELNLKSLQKITEKYVKNNTTIVTETGTSWITTIFMKLKQDSIFQIQMQYGSIGWSLPAALGCYLAKPSNDLMLFIGDGSLQMTVQSISTMIRYNMKGIIFIINNKGYVIEDALHKGPYNKLNNWDYSKLLELFNKNNYNKNTKMFDIYTNNDLINALNYTKKYKKLYIFNCNISNKDIQKKLITWGKLMGKYNNRKSKYY